MSKKCVCRELNLSNPTEFYGHFIFTSLESGEGVTLGNMLRRTLISQLSGSKVIGVKFNNINHEFSDVEGVREDILEIFLNLKEIIIKNPSNYDVCYGKLEIVGPSIVTAGLIELPQNVSILNPHHYLFTITESISIDIRLKIEHGKSYILATDRKLENLGEFLPLDANFTPILGVEYYIQPINEYIEKTQEELHMIVSTNGTLLPHEAILLATNNLSKLLLTCRNLESINCNNDKRNLNVQPNKHFHKTYEEDFDKTVSTIVTNPINSVKNFKPGRVVDRKYKKNSIISSRIFDHNKSYSNIIKTPTKNIDLRIIDIEITCLPNRIISTLRKAKINFMSDLLNYSIQDLEKIKGLGPISIKKIKNQINLFFEAISL